jgi:hypothetical protein
MIEHDDAEGTPQSYGFPENPTMSDWQVWNRQELFLKAYARIGKIGKAAAATEIPVATVESWQRRDTHGFKKRMQLAHQAYVESLEQLMDERLSNPTGNRGSDVLLMFKLKAEAPEKYREEVKVLGVSAPLQMLEKLKELATKDLREREAVEAPAIEAEYRDISVPKQEPRSETPPRSEVRGDMGVTSRPQGLMPRDVNHTLQRPVSDKEKPPRKVSRR